MRQKGPALLYLRGAMIFLALLLPLLSLLPLGWLWLWQQRLRALLARGALAISACAYLVQVYRLAPQRRRRRRSPSR